MTALANARPINGHRGERGGHSGGCIGGLPNGEAAGQGISLLTGDRLLNRRAKSFEKSSGFSAAQVVKPSSQTAGRNGRILTDGQGRRHNQRIEKP